MPDTIRDAIQYAMDEMNVRQECINVLAAEIAALKEQLAAAEQARAVAEANLQFRSMSNMALRELIGDTVEGLNKLYLGYVNTLETGRDRILFFGGSCDPVDVMERDDPTLREARALIARAKGAAL